jgi:hypothetical protein
MLDMRVTGQLRLVGLQKTTVACRVAGRAKLNLKGELHLAMFGFGYFLGDIFEFMVVAALMAFQELGDS